MPPAANGNSFGSGNARHQGTTPILGGVCPSSLIAKHSVFAILALLMPVTILSLSFALPDAIVMAHFVGSSHAVVPYIVVYSRYMQHHCNAHLCGKVPKMPLSAMLLASSFSCVSVCMSASVISGKEGSDSNKGGKQAPVTATKRAMAMAIRVAGNKVGNDDGGKSKYSGI